MSTKVSVEVAFGPVVALLTEIRDRLPAPAPAAPAAPAAEMTVRPPKGSQLARVKRDTLAAVLLSLNGWIEGAKDNHQAMEHRDEATGEECWRRFAPDDIRRMVNEAAHEMGIEMFPFPHPAPEDAPVDV